MFPADLESARRLLDLVSGLSEPLALMGLGAVLIALSFRLRSRPTHPVDPAPAATEKPRPRVTTSSPLATHHGQS